MYDWAEYRYFKYLLAIVEKNGFRAAAEELHTTQPDLSAQAKQFHEQSGLRLYQIQEWTNLSHGYRYRIQANRKGST